MNAKQLYNKHLKLCTPDDYQSPKQMEMYKYEASISAINEALEMYEKVKDELLLTESHIELLEDGGFSD